MCLKCCPYSVEIAYELQLQSGPRQELINVTVAALGGNPRELMNRRNRLQLQFCIPAELANHCSCRIAAFWIDLETCAMIKEKAPKSLKIGNTALPVENARKISEDFPGPQRHDIEKFGRNWFWVHYIILNLVRKSHKNLEKIGWHPGGEECVKWETYHRWGGPKPFLGRGFMVCFSPPLSFPPPSVFLWC